MTDQDLKLALAKMLPEKIFPRQHNRYNVSTGMHDPTGFNIEWIENHVPINDTEWLHVCWLVEETLSEFEGKAYWFAMNNLHATWQQRAAALIKVKGTK